MQRAKLKGSPKQVSWATDIRERMISDVDRDLGKFDLWIAERTIEPDKADELRESYRRVRDFLCRQTSARFFIDYRQVGVAYFYEAMADLSTERG